jgi:hypothetical protein
VLVVDETKPGSTSETGPNPRWNFLRPWLVRGIDDLMGSLQYSLMLGLSIENHHILYIILEYVTDRYPHPAGRPEFRPCSPHELCGCF